MPRLTEQFVDACLKLSDAEKSKLSDVERQLFGQSSIKIKCLLNNLCNKDGTRYLELGTYRGSTLVGALYGNAKTSAVGVDNFSYDFREPKKVAPDDSGWPNVKSGLYDILQKYEIIENIKSNHLKIIEASFGDVSWSSQPKFDIIYCDIEPITEEVYDHFFTKVFHAMSRQCVVLFSGYSSEESSKLLEQKIEQYSDRLVTEFKKQRISSGNADAFAYYSGLAIYGFRKKAFAQND
tara:strand:+ start:756 stop:1466 length:711 start_codon:yes stop_codon:yes gene_type:complete